MTLDEYQEAAANVSKWAPGGEKSIAYYALKLNGEAGEVAELIGKVWRGDLGIEPTVNTIEDLIAIHPEVKDKLVRELGDVLWYIQKIASKIEVSLDEVGLTNIAKLQARVDRKAAGLDPKAGEGR